MALKNLDHQPRAACWRLPGVGLLGVGPLGVEVAGLVLLIHAEVSPLGEVVVDLLVDAEVGPLGAEVEVDLLVEVEVDPLFSLMKSLASFSSLKLKAVLSVLKSLASFSSLKWWSSVVELNCWA